MIDLVLDILMAVVIAAILLGYLFVISTLVHHLRYKKFLGRRVVILQTNQVPQLYWGCKGHVFSLESKFAFVNVEMSDKAHAVPVPYEHLRIL